jgi:hypothetical protein
LVAGSRRRTLTAVSNASIPRPAFHEVYEGLIAGWQPDKNPVDRSRPVSRDAGTVDAGGFGLIPGVVPKLMCVGLTLGSIWVFEHTTPFSFLWWLSLVVAIVSGVYTVVILLAVPLVLFAIAVLISLFLYFLQHPW